MLSRMVDPLTPEPAPKVQLRAPWQVSGAPSPTLTVVDEGGLHGPAFDFLLERPVTMVGRCGELRLEDPLVSRRHVALIRDHEGTLLSDLGGQNPALLNGAPVVRGATVRLREGDLVSLGKTTLVYHAPRPAAPPSDSALLGPAPGATPPFPLPPMTGVALEPVTSPPPVAPAPRAASARRERLAEAQAPAASEAGTIFGIVSIMAGLALGGVLLLLAAAPPPTPVSVAPAPPSGPAAPSVAAPPSIAPPPAAAPAPPEPAPAPAPAPPAVEVERPPTAPPQVIVTLDPPAPPAPELPRAARATCERLLGRAPTAAEEEALGHDPAAWVTWLLAQEALHARWWRAELAAFGLADAPPATADGPSLDALRAAATSPAFTRRHGGEVPFADAVAGLLLGLHEGDPARRAVHDAARHVAAGWPREALGVEARTPRDLVRAAVKDPRFARAALERALERVLDRAPTPDEVEAAFTAFFLDPTAPGALLRVVVRRGLEG